MFLCQLLQAARLGYLAFLAAARQSDTVTVTDPLTQHRNRKSQLAADRPEVIPKSKLFSISG